MTKQEFLEELKNALAGEVSSEVVMDSYRYYADYIESEIRSGKTESQVLEELGKPNLIARSIIAAQEGQRDADVEYTEGGRTKKVHNSNIPKREKGNQKEKKEFVFDFNAWYVKLLLIAILVILVILVFFIIKIGLWMLLTFGVPILLVLGLFYLFLYFIGNHQ